MKKLSGVLCFILTTCTAQAQNTNDYFLTPGNGLTLPVSAKAGFTINMLKLDGALVMPGPDIMPEWTLNGQPRPDPSLGKLSTNLASVVVSYQAPDRVPEKNPVALAVSFTVPGAKTKLVLVCNITITAADNYFDLQGGGQANTVYYFDNRFAGPMALQALTMAMVQDGQTVITISGHEKLQRNDHSAPATLNMSLLVEGHGPGVYTWKLPPEGETKPATVLALIIQNTAASIFPIIVQIVCPIKTNTARQSH